MITLFQKMKLLGGLFAGGTAYTGPFFATVDPTRRCNLNCLGCRYHSKEIDIPSPGDQSIKDLPVDLFERLCEDLKKRGTKEMVFTGEGEPLMHPELFKILSIARRVGLSITLFTNGTLLDETTVKGLIDSGVDTLRVSHWANSAEEYVKNYPGTNPDLLEKVNEGMLLLSRLKEKMKSEYPLLDLHKVINSYNFESVDETVKLAERTGCNSVSFSVLKNFRGKLSAFSLSPDEENSFCSSLLHVKEDLKELDVRHDIDHVLMRYRFGNNVWEKLPCYMGWMHCRVKVDGSVLPCDTCDIVMGNLNENSFDEIWNGTAFRRFRRQVLTREGLASMNKHCDCGYCCHLKENKRVDSIFKWFRPFIHKDSGSDGIYG